jgi:hypothetical protein
LPGCGDTLVASIADPDDATSGMIGRNRDFLKTTAIQHVATGSVD